LKGVFKDVENRKKDKTLQWGDSEDRIGGCRREEGRNKLEHR
jgi:hypothetical protein